MQEDTGLDITPIKLLTVLEKCHTHNPEADNVYKFFIQYNIEVGDFEGVFDILEKVFFSEDALPPLTLKRVLSSPFALMFRYLEGPLKPSGVD